MRGSILLVVGLAGLLFAGCTRSTAVPASDANLTPRDRELLANAPYAAATIPEPYRKHLVDYPGAETPGTILIDTDARFLYYVLPSRKAIRYGVAVGEEAVAWSGVAQVGRKAEWPDWIPTPDIQARLGPYPPRVPGGPANPMGARAIYLYQGGQARSSGCIRMTNEDVIDLYDRVNTGTTVVVLAPGQGSLRRSS